MSELSVGKDCISFCKKCDLALAHIIVVMKDDKTPKRVQCNTCKATHVYNDPNDTKVKKVTKRKTKPKVINSEVWQKALSKSENSPVSYSPKGSFALGDVLEHPTFGKGIVERCMDRNKIEVLFQNDIKILVHNI